MTPELRESIDAAYVTFGSYTVSRPLDVCTACCVVPEQERLLLNPRVREIPFRTLDIWNHAAKPHEPSLAEFKHFLPRFLEMVASFEFSSISVELSLRSFQYYRDTDWTEAERKIISAFAQAYFRHCLSLYPPPGYAFRIDELLLMLWPAPIEFDALLRCWEETDTIEATSHFAEFVLQGLKNAPELDYENAFAGPDFKARLVDWVTDDRVVLLFSQRLEDLILGDDQDGEVDQAELSWALDRLLWMGTKHAS
ncbi:MAG: hypothetical protein AAF441_01500 [Pseudomonadota bacterium]